MALTAYCKKCGREVEPGEVCARCGTRLGKTAAHAAWCVRRRPVADWMSWNAVMRVLLPVFLAVLLLVFLLELLSGGAGALERVLQSGLPVTLGILLLSVTVVVLLALLLQGEELMDYVVDSRGIHVTRYLPAPTPLRLLLRFRSPALMNQASEGGTAPVVKVDSRDLAWKDVARVQLWPEKCMVLFYSPAFWLKVPVLCTPFAWEDVMGFIREKLGKKKKVGLPAQLRVTLEKRAAAQRRPAAQTRSMSLEVSPARAVSALASPPFTEDAEKMRAAGAEGDPEGFAERNPVPDGRDSVSEGQVSMEEMFQAFPEDSGNGMENDQQ